MKKTIHKPENTVPVWHDINKKKPIHSDGGDTEVLLRVDGLPMQYIAANWDGRYWHIYSGNTTAPWAILPDSVKVIEWAYVPDPNESKTAVTKIGNEKDPVKRLQSYLRTDYALRLSSLQSELLMYVKDIVRTQYASCLVLDRENPIIVTTVGKKKSFEVYSLDIIDDKLLIHTRATGTEPAHTFLPSEVEFPDSDTLCKEVMKRTTLPIKLELLVNYLIGKRIGFSNKKHEPKFMTISRYISRGVREEELVFETEDGQPLALFDDEVKRLVKNGRARTYITGVTAYLEDCYNALYEEKKN